MKVYISKSKAGNPDDLMKVRYLLSKYDCEVTEFMGGEYTPTNLDASNLVIVIPPNTKEQFVGRGQYDEIRRSLNKRKPVICVIGREEGPPDAILIEWCKEYEASDANWQNKYGLIFTRGNDEIFSLEKWLEIYTVKRKRISHPEPFESDKRLLLISKPSRS